jgi:hypothetical protein
MDPSSDTEIGALKSRGIDTQPPLAIVLGRSPGPLARRSILRIWS